MDSVIRRFDSDRPSPSHHDLHGIAHIVEIIQRLAHAHQHDIGEHASIGTVGVRAFLVACIVIGKLHIAFRPFAQSVHGPSITCPTISPGVRLRTSRIVPV